MNDAQRLSNEGLRDINRVAPLLDTGETKSDWETKRRQIQSVWMHTLGEAPLEDMYDSEALGEGAYTVLSEKQEEDHCCQHIRYETKDQDLVHAYLLLPRGVSPAAPRPAVLALHPTTEVGKADVALASGRDNRRYGLELARRGYIVLAPDSITFGERIYEGEAPFQTAPFYKRFPAWSAVGKMLTDHIRGVDLLTSMKQVRPDRIGVIGHSLGGYNGWFLAGMDSRIRAVASSCGFSLFQGDPDPNRWGRRDWFSHFAGLTEVMKQGGPPFEWHEIAALAAPVPMFMWCGMRDAIFPNWLDNTHGLAELMKLYRGLGRESDFECWLGTEGHDFPPDLRERAYRFLDAHLLI